MTALRRFQLRRIKGWRLPPNTVSVARPTPWGNPFEIRHSRCNGWTVIGRHGRVWGGIKSDRVARRFAVIQFRKWVLDFAIHVPGYTDPLRGKNLACWCPLDQPCHADVLLEIANREAGNG